jgi:hypothetical protein
MILTHGFCGSTCAVFAKHLNEAAIVRSLTIGGLPNRPQSIASFPGGQVFTLDELMDTLEYLDLTHEPRAPARFPVSARFSFTVREIYSWTPGLSNIPLDFVFEPSTYHAPYSKASSQSDAALYLQAVKYFDSDVPCAPNCPGLTLMSIMSIVFVSLAILGVLTAAAYYYIRSRREVPPEIIGHDDGEHFHESQVHLEVDSAAHLGVLFHLLFYYYFFFSSILLLLLLWLLFSSLRNSSLSCPFSFLSIFHLRATDLLTIRPQ